MRQLRAGIVIGIAAVIALGVSFGGLGIGAAEDQSTIAFVATGKMAKRAGDSCIVGEQKAPPASMTGNQVIIENAEGIIVAVRQLGSFPLENGDTPSDVVESCIVHFSIDVPKSSFYRVFVDDTLLVAVNAGDLPFDTESSDPSAPQAPWIDFGE